jgi:hypothetical protein
MNILRAALVALAASAAVQAAHADIIMYANNEAGGLIQLSDMPCSKITGYPSLSSMSGYAASIIDSAGVARFIGCYQYTEPNFHVTWNNGNQRFYRAEGMTLTAAGKRLLSQLYSGS